MKNKGTSALDRRQFIKLSAWTLSAGAVASTGLPLFHLKHATASAFAEGLGPVTREKLGNWQDLYRQRWSWDHIAKGSHGWLNCRSACEWDLYVKNGIVVREEQTATYEASEEGVPDFNPRGCQKGACYTEVMYGPSRLTTPMKRIGERGSGQWEKVSWDQALEEIAEKLVKIAEEDGTDSVVHDLGPHFDNGPTTAGRVRFFSKFGGAMPDDWAEIGDLNLGATMTFGFPHVGGSSDEWFLSDFLVVWMMNPSVTQIPDAHFLYEAKYNGAKLTVIDPQYTATSTHADHWLPIEVGSDAALALYTARYIWDSGNMDEAYVKEQTDLPFLVRIDDGRFLRESDLKEGGKDNLLYIWDQNKNEMIAAHGSEGNKNNPRLFLKDIDPAIEGKYDIELVDGSIIPVVTVGTILKEQLEMWTDEATAKTTGLSKGMIKQFAKGFAEAKRPMVLSSWGSNRFFHSDLMNRAKILCLSLKGAVGKKGAGYHSTGWFSIEGFLSASEVPDTSVVGSIKFLNEIMSTGDMVNIASDLIMRRKTLLDVGAEMSRKLVTEKTCMTNSASLNYRYQGIQDELAQEEDKLGYPKKLKEYVKESEDKNWMPIYPRKAVKAWITGGNNVLRRTNLTGEMFENLWKNLDIAVDVNQKLTFTGMHSDYLLPAAGYYEKSGIKYPVAYVPYLHYCDAAVKPLADCKDEWEIYYLLSEKIQKIARQHNTPILDGCGKKPINLQNIAEEYSFERDFKATDTEKVAQYILDHSTSTFGFKVEDLKKTGIKKYTGTGITEVQSQLYNSDWHGDGIMQALTHFVKDKWHWPTLTGRQQFYIDHPWFIGAGESLPTHKSSPKAGGDYPFQMVSCHSRWSVHSIWRDTPLLLRLQRGEPVLYLNHKDMEKQNVVDGGWAAINNDYGNMRMRVKASTMVRPGVAYYFHAWEPFQFPDHKSYKWLTPGLMKPLHWAGGEGHLKWNFAIWEPGTAVQDTRVDIHPWVEAKPSNSETMNKKGASL